MFSQCKAGYALDIQNAGQNLLSLINDILDLSKIESGKLEIIPVEYDFSSLIHDIMNMITVKAENKGLAVRLNIDEELPSRLWGDDVKIRQVLINLMNNAVKYTEQGSVTLTVEGEVKENDIFLTFSVEDTGIGIHQEDLAKLFTEFERIEEQRNRNIEGTGLGMSITVQLLNLMDSRLYVESEYGKGSRFYFTLKQEIKNREPIGNLEKRIKEQSAQYSYKVTFNAPDAHILVVDDNAVNRRVFVNLLKETKIQIDEAGGGLECLEMIQEKQYDMIFLDHMMPEPDGIETLHRILEIDSYKSTPVVALTANAVSGAKEMYLAEGFYYFLSKPINPEKLEKIIMETLPKEKIILEEIHKKEKAESLNDDHKPLWNLENMPVIEGINWEYALLHCKDLPMLTDTIHDFYQLADMEYKNLKDISGSMENAGGQAQFVQIMEQYRIKVHSMKSSAAMIGAVSLSGIAQILLSPGDYAVFRGIKAGSCKFGYGADYRCNQ